MIFAPLSGASFCFCGEEPSALLFFFTGLPRFVMPALSMIPLTTFLVMFIFSPICCMLRPPSSHI